MIVRTVSSYVDKRVINQALRILEDNGIIIYPTDTVYGMGCLINTRKALKRLYSIKRKRPDKPFSFICHNIKQASQYAIIDDRNFKIITDLTPGPYTFVLPAKKTTPRDLRSQENTVGIRIPANDLILELVKEAQIPLITTSVTIDNFFTSNCIDDIINYYEYLVDLIIVDEEFQPTQPSTILDLTSEEIKILREGAGKI